MSIECEELEYCKIKVNYTAEESVVEAKQKEAIKQLKNLRIPGFRPGKAPEHIIKLRFKDRISDWVKREMIAQAYDDILFETKIRPIGFPQTLQSTLEKSKFYCELLFLKKPEFELQEIKGLEVPKPAQDKTAIELAEEMIQDLRMQHGEVRPYEENDSVNNGDKITMDIKTTLNEETIDAYSAEGLLYHVGSDKEYISGFNANILGMTPGEQRKFEAVLGDNVLPTQVGKTAIVEVMLHMGMRTVPCALDDDFAKKFNCESYSKLRTEIETIANNKVKNTENKLITEQVKKQLISKHDFEVPQWLLTMEAQEIAQREGANWQSMTNEVREEYSSKAKDSVKLALILDTIQQNEPEAALTDSEVYEILKQKLISIGLNDPNAYLVQAQKTGQLIGMIASTRNEHALQWIVNNVKIIE